GAGRAAGRLRAAPRAAPARRRRRRARRLRGATTARRRRVRDEAPLRAPGVPRATGGPSAGGAGHRRGARNRLRADAARHAPVHEGGARALPRARLRRDRAVLRESRSGRAFPGARPPLILLGFHLPYRFGTGRLWRSFWSLESWASKTLRTDSSAAKSGAISISPILRSPSRGASLRFRWGRVRARW